MDLCNNENATLKFSATLWWYFFLLFILVFNTIWLHRCVMCRQNLVFLLRFKQSVLENEKSLYEKVSKIWQLLLRHFKV